MSPARHMEGSGLKPGIIGFKGVNAAVDVVFKVMITGQREGPDCYISFLAKLPCSAYNLGIHNLLEPAGRRKGRVSADNRNISNDQFLMSGKPFPRGVHPFLLVVGQNVALTPQLLVSLHDLLLHCVSFWLHFTKSYKNPYFK